MPPTTFYFIAHITTIRHFSGGQIISIKPTTTTNTGTSFCSLFIYILLFRTLNHSLSPETSTKKQKLFTIQMPKSFNNILPFLNTIRHTHSISLTFGDHHTTYLPPPTRFHTLFIPPSLTPSFLLNFLILPHFWRPILLIPHFWRQHQFGEYQSSTYHHQL